MEADHVGNFQGYFWFRKYRDDPGGLVCIERIFRSGDLESFVFISDIFCCQSLFWLVSGLWRALNGWALHGKVEEAEKNVKHFLGQDVYIGELASKKDKTTRPQSSRRDIFARGNIKRIVLSGIPWGCEGMGVYGIGIFTPVLLLTLGLIPESGKAFPRVVESLRFTFYINVFVMLGFIIGLTIVRKLNLLHAQTFGFFLCALGLSFTLLGVYLSGTVGSDLRRILII